jgi:GDP-L-fucose synthase
MKRGIGFGNARIENAKAIMEKKILILGGHGFIGKNLAAALNKANHQVIIKSRADGVDLANFESIKKSLEEIKPDFIFNLAAHTGSLHYVTTYAADVITDNVEMALNLYKSVKEICPNSTIINPLSNCSYPGASDFQTETAWWNGPVHDSVFSYGNAKRFIYVLAKCYAKQYSIKSINFLVPNTFGPGDSADPNKTHALNGMIIRMIKAQKEQAKEFEIWGTGSPFREWAYVNDVINALVQSLEITDGLIEPVNIGQNKGYTIKQSAEFIAEALGFTGQLVFNTKYQDGAPQKVLDNKKFKEIFPSFEFFDHKQGILETVNYYKSVL